MSGADWEMVSSRLTKARPSKWRDGANATVRVLRHIASDRTGGGLGYMKVLDQDGCPKRTSGFAVSKS